MPKESHKGYNPYLFYYLNARLSCFVLYNQVTLHIVILLSFVHGYCIVIIKGLHSV